MKAFTDSSIYPDFLRTVGPWLAISALSSWVGIISAQETVPGGAPPPFLFADAPQAADKPASVAVDLDLTVEPEDLRTSLQALAEVSAQRMVRASEGETIRDLVLRVFPELITFGPDKTKLIDGLVEVVQEQNRTLLVMLGHPTDGELRRFSERALVTFPELPRFGKTRTVVAATDTTREKLAELYLGTLSDPDRVAVAEANPGVVGWAVAQAHQRGWSEAPSLSAKVKTGKSLVLERKSLSDVIPVRPGLEADSAVRELNDTAGTGRAAVVPIAELMSSTEDLKCCDHPPVWYADLMGLGDLDTRDLERLSIATVAVMDSGLEVGHQGFRNMLAHKTKFSVIETNGVRKLDDEHDKGHGTAVSGLAVGRMLSSALPDESFRAVENALRLLVLRVAKKGRVGRVSDVKTFGSYGLMDLAAELTHPSAVRVINMSLVYPPATDYLELLQLKMRQMPQILFVAAAGNKGWNLDQRQVFPATVQGKNLLSVAALDEAGKIYESSNYGLKKVQIAAPGRAIWSTVPQGRLKSCPESPATPSWMTEGSHWCLSGTSLAAPLVSLTAGLLAARGLDSGARIKRRLLASCDWRPELATCEKENDGKCIERGCTLNFGRALSLGRDLVEVNTGAGLKLLRGRVKSVVSTRGGTCGSVRMSPREFMDPRPGEESEAGAFLLRASRKSGDRAGFTFLKGEPYGSAAFDSCESQMKGDKLTLRLVDETTCPPGAPGTEDGPLDNGQCRIDMSIVNEVVFRDPYYCSRFKDECSL